MATSVTSASRRPRVICPMMASVDGRIVTGHWTLSPEGRRQYELVHASYEADGWICGRVTLLCGRRTQCPRRRQRDSGPHAIP